jgi:hypothetical protein
MINWENIEKQLEQFLKNELEKTKLDRFTIDGVNI